MDTQCLWIQQRIRNGSIELGKVRGEVNPADLFTKHLPSRDRVHRLLALLNCRYVDGRPESAPQLRRIEGDSTPALSAAAGGITVEVGGMHYPGVWADGVLVAEAYAHDGSILPHQHGSNLAKMFPRAQAAESTGDQDTDQNDWPLDIGLAVGMRNKWKMVQAQAENSLAALQTVSPVALDGPRRWERRPDEACLQRHAGRRSCEEVTGGGTPDIRHPTSPRTIGGEPLKPRAAREREGGVS